MGTRKAVTIGAVIGLLVVGGICWGDPYWNGAPYSFSIPTSISGRGHAVNSTFNLTLVHDVAGCTVQFTAVGDNYLLKNGANSLITSYKLTGACLIAPDADWVLGADFMNKPYGVIGTGVDTINLSVQGQEPGGATHVPPGTYQATLRVVVSWS